MENKPRLFYKMLVIGVIVLFILTCYPVIPSISAPNNTNNYGWVPLDNKPPEAPTIEGPSKGKPGIKYDFTFYAEDLDDDDDVSYYIEWGDGTTTGWTDYFESGQPADFSHTWDKIEEFPIRCKAKDIYNAEGDWSNYIIYIPRNMVFDSNLNLLERLLERFPLLEVLLRIMNLLR